MKRCRGCGKLFEPSYSSLQKACSAKCAIDFSKTDKGQKYVEDQKARESRETRRARKLQAKTRGMLAKEAESAFNRWVRLRDQGKPCVSCGTRDEVQWHASHYKSVGGHPELRFDEDNVHAACRRCNELLSGNLIEYRKTLLIRVGEEAVDRLEGPQEAKHYSREDLIEIRKKYAARCRALQNG